MSSLAAPTIGILAAIEDELAPTIQRLQLQRDDKGVYHGQGKSSPLVALLSGVGAGRAEIAFDSLVQTHHCQWVFHIGFAAGLVRELRPGQAEVFTAVSDTGGHAFRLDTIPPMALSSKQLLPEDKVLLTVPELLHQSLEKRAASVLFDALAADMESYYIANAAARGQVRLTVLRGISDPWDMNIPPESVTWVNENGKRDTKKALDHLLRHPLDVPSVVRLGFYARRAATAIAGRLESCLIRGRTAWIPGEAQRGIKW